MCTVPLFLWGDEDSGHICIPSLRRPQPYTLGRALRSFKILYGPSGSRCLPALVPCTVLLAHPLQSRCMCAHLHMCAQSGTPRAERGIPGSPALTMAPLESPRVCFGGLTLSQEP